MRRTRTVCLSLAGLALAVGMAGCGGSSAVTGGEDAPGAAPSAAAGNAVVQGSVVGGAEGVQVTVVGSSISARTDEDGQFALTSVPAGTVTLQFQGTGVDARLSVPDVRDGQVTSISVKLSGAEAQMTTMPTCGPTADTFFTGQIESISGTLMVVSGRKVDMSEVNKIWRGDRRMELADLHVGDKVKVWGSLRGDGVVVADEIVLMSSPPGEDGTSWIAFKGRIQSISEGSGVRQSCVYPILVVDGTTVYTGAGTTFANADGGSYDPSVLKVGMTVYVEGWKKSNGSVNAKLVRL